MVKKKSISLLSLKIGFRSLKKNIGQFLAIILIGAISMTLFVGLLSNAQAFGKQIDDTFARGNLPDFFVTCSQVEEEDRRAIDEIIGDDGEIEERIYLPCKIGNHDAYAVVTDSLPQISKPYEIIEQSEEHSENHYALLDYGWMYKQEPIKSDKYELGDVFYLTVDMTSLGYADKLTKLEPIIEGYVKEDGENVVKDLDLSIPMKVTGFMNHPENITKANYNPAVVLLSFDVFRNALVTTFRDNYNSTGELMLRQMLMNKLGEDFFTCEKLPYHNQILIRLKDPSLAETYRDRIKEYFNGKKEDNLLLLTKKEEMPFYLTLYTDRKQALQFTYVFPAVFFFVAILVILTTLSQLILKDRTKIGTMKALGMTKHEILRSYLFISILVVGLGILFGEILGPLIIPGILGQKYSLLYTLPKRTYQFPVAGGILSAIFFLGVSLLVTYLVARKEIALKPVDSMRPSIPKFKEVKHAEKKSKVTGLSLRMALRNIRLSLGKSIMVIVGILGCTALLVCGFGLEDTVNYGLDHDVKMFMSADVHVSFASSMGSDEVLNSFEDIEGIEKIELYRKMQCTFSLEEGNQTTKLLYVVSSYDSHIKLDIPKDGVILSSKIARTIGCKTGDTILMQVGSTLYEAELVGTFDAFYYNCAVLPFDSPVFQGEPEKYNGAWVDCKEGYTREETAARIQDSLSFVTGSFAKESMSGNIKDVMSSILVMTNAVKVFALLLAIVVLYNFARLNFHERMRDIATLKVLGFQKREIGLTLMFEIVSLTFVGVLFGLFAGYPFMLLVLKTNIVEIVDYLYHISLLSYFAAFLFTFVVAFLMNLYFSNKTKKIPMVESLKSIE